MLPMDDFFLTVQGQLDDMPLRRRRPVPRLTGDTRNDAPKITVMRGPS
jgi:hypothetical protein